jgi:hypothetical protein
MRSSRFNVTVFVFFLASCVLAQDSAFTETPDTIPLKKHELGASILSPLIVLTGATDPSDRFTNITYRYLVTKKHALKIFAGFSLFNASVYNSQDYPYIATTGQTVHPVSETIVPSNFQAGLGYEIVLGTGRVRHAVGIDGVYNNKFEITKFQYRITRDSVDGAGNKFPYSFVADTGKVSRGFTYQKLGFNVHYTLRYEYSTHWMVTTTFLMSYRNYRGRENNSYLSDLEMNGLISDVSIFYRF